MLLLRKRFAQCWILLAQRNLFFPFTFLLRCFQYLQHIVGLIMLRLKRKCALQHRLFLQAFTWLIRNTIIITCRLKNQKAKDKPVSYLKYDDCKSWTRDRDGCWSELDSNAGNPDCKFNAWTTRVHSQITSGYRLKQNPECYFPFRQERGKGTCKTSICWHAQLYN